MWFWLFIVSVSINIFLMVYINWLLKIMKNIQEEVKDKVLLITDFNQHIKSIYELEMFYGDKTLEGLLNHGKDLVSALNDIDLIVEEGEKEIDATQEE
jgi:hypothetical protein